MSNETLQPVLCDCLNILAEGNRGDFAKDRCVSGKILLVFRGEENDFHIRRVSISYIVRDNNGGSIPVRSAFHYRLALSHEPNITSVISSVHSVFPVPHAP